LYESKNVQSPQCNNAVRGTFLKNVQSPQCNNAVRGTFLRGTFLKNVQSPQCNNAVRGTFLAPSGRYWLRGCGQWHPSRIDVYPGEYQIGEV
jgi:hypothetical protein